MEKLVYSIHLGIAAVTHIPEFVLDETEAKAMAEGLARVSRHYPTVVEKMGAKSLDHVNLATLVIGIYGSRFAAYKIRRANEKPTASDNVMTLRPGTNGFGT